MENQSLYDWLSEQYDRLIQWNERLPREIPLLLKLLPKPDLGSILDLGCGTGGHLQVLSDNGYQCYGIDVSENLIKVAQQKLPHLSHNLVVGDMISGVPKEWNGLSAQICLGNTLSHLDKNKIKIFLENAFLRSKKDGILIIENRNWDRILKQQERFLKPVFSEDYLFIRVLDFLSTIPDVVKMTVALWHQGVWQSSSVQLYAYSHSQLYTLFCESGWQLKNEFGNLAGEPYDVNHSTDWVSVWQKTND